MRNISSIKYSTFFLYQNCPAYLVSLNPRSNKIIICVYNYAVRSILNFLARSIVIKANNLLDVG